MGVVVLVVGDGWIVDLDYVRGVVVFVVDDVVVGVWYDCGGEWCDYGGGCDWVVGDEGVGVVCFVLLGFLLEFDCWWLGGECGLCCVWVVLV